MGMPTAKSCTNSVSSYAKWTEIKYISGKLSLQAGEPAGKADDQRERSAERRSEREEKCASMADREEIRRSGYQAAQMEEDRRAAEVARVRRRSDGFTFMAITM